MTPVIEAKGLTKRYGQAIAVDALDLTIEAGEVFGLLGPNGAGKTTSILLFLGLTEPSTGHVRVLGFDPLREPLKVKRKVGYLPDAVGFYDHLTARENLTYTARLGGIATSELQPRIDAALSRVRLSDMADRRVATFSRGMRQRLGIAELLVKACEVAILDEPTAGLDPQSTQELLELIGRLSREGMTVILSSHLLNMVEAVCSRVALFHRGKAGLVGRVPDLARQVLGGFRVTEVEAQGCQAEALLGRIAGVTRISSSASGVLRVEADRDLRNDIAKTIIQAGGTLSRLSSERSSLDEVYVRYFEQVTHAA